MGFISFVSFPKALKSIPSLSCLQSLRGTRLMPHFSTRAPCLPFSNGIFPPDAKSVLLLCLRPFSACSCQCLQPGARLCFWAPGAGSVASSHPRGEGEVTAEISPCWVTSLLLLACQVWSGTFCVVSSAVTPFVSSQARFVSWVVFPELRFQGWNGVIFRSNDHKAPLANTVSFEVWFPYSQNDHQGCTEHNPHFSGKTKT